MRKCPVCESSEFELIYSEPSEYRGGKPIIPEGIYNQTSCQRCALLLVDSQVDDSYLISMYNAEFSDLDLSNSKISENLDIKENLIRLKYNMIRPHLNVQTGKKWLDIGSQYGGLLEFAQHDGYDVYGIDLCKEYCDFTASRLGLPDDKLYSKDLLQVDFEDSFDVISMLETLEHIVDFKPYLQKIDQLLNPGGIFLLSVPTAEFQRMRIFLKKNLNLKFGGILKPSNQLLVHTHMYNFSIKSLEYLRKDFGYYQVKTIPIGYSNYLATSGILNPLNYLWRFLSRVLFIKKIGFTIANDILVIWRKSE